MTWLVLLRRFWPVLPIIALGLWGARLDQLRARHKANLAACQADRKLDHANAATAAAKAETGWLQQQVDAGKALVGREAAREPIIIHSRDMVREYAKSDAGRVLCRAADRVRAVDTLDADLAADPRPASGSTSAVPTDTAAPPARR
ncbi:hypothetical protein [Sphingomonas rubra]|uniref:Uncharacterized protein n=1 Tax=Sphingomonas rubra TaxID=634430 RepID=A0A1I5UV82_9SPHN|nr:hypothetical protein [Sphingomonas rubra]SFP98626.1 hypothetical protein SAMN04488241_11612 [Sphingomonas rubra]